MENNDIDTSRLSAAYILLLLAYIRVNIRKNTDKPQCCYRLYKTISEDIGISERYVTRIVEILDVMDIIKNDKDFEKRVKNACVYFLDMVQ